MADFTLTPAPVLDGYDHDFGTVRLTEAIGIAIVSIATPLGAEAAVGKAVKAGLKLGMPQPTHTTTDGTVTLVSSAADQMMAVFAHATPDANAFVQSKLKGAAYTTDQTDNWVVLDIDGPDSRRALERLCPINLHPQAFGIGQNARTVMEHMGALVIRTGPDSYRLMSASSSAASFLHALEVSIKNIS
ncbi:sarcosine oxidase subunit gamma [Algirhabdus cladophorae]